MKTSVLYLVAIIGLYLNASAQQWTRYNSYKSGLSHNTVYDILVEKNGTKWFATYYGISKLVDSTWTKYNSTNGLSGNRVYCIAIDTSGNKWFGTDNGLSKYNGSTFTNYTTSDGLANNIVRSIAIDKKGKKWIGTDGGLSVYNDTTFVNYTNSNGLPGISVQAIAFDEQTNVWLGFNGTLSKYNGISFTNYYPGSSTFFGNSVNSIAIDLQNKIWLGTDVGAAVYNGTTWNNYTYKPGELGDNMVRKVVIDGKGNKWFGTNAGISKFDGNTWLNYTVADGLSSNWVNTIAFEKPEIIWLGYDMSGVSKLAAPTLSVSSQFLGIPPIENGKTYFNITSNANWTLTSSDEWLRANKASGTGNSSITLIAKANPSAILVRPAVITISAIGLDPVKINVMQAPADPILVIEPKTIELPGTENSEAFLSIQSNGGWKATYDTSWMKLSEEVGMGMQTLMVRAKANTSGTSRSTKIFFGTYGLKPDSVIVTQAAEAPVLFTSPSKLNIGYSLNSKATYSISSNVNWTAASDQAWLTVETPAGNGNAQVIVTAKENTNTISRSAKITLTGNGVSNKTIDVVQAGKPYFNLSTNKIDIAAAENSTNKFIITCNSRCELSWSALWFRLNRSNVEGNDTVIITAEKNYLSQKRTGYIFVELGNTIDTITLIQAEGPFVSISANTLNIDAAGGNNTKFIINSNTSWNISSSYGLVTADTTKGTGTDTITLKTAANTGTVPLTDYLIIKDTTDIYKTINIIQACADPYLKVDTTFLHLNKEENSSATFTISTNQSWTATVDYIFFHLDKESGTGNATVTITADKNQINNPVNGIITIYKDGVPAHTIKVTQESANFFMLIEQDTFHITANGTPSVTFKVISNIEWGVSNNNNWISFNKAMSSNNDTIKATATVNYEPNKRIGNCLLYSTYYGVNNVPLTFIQDSIYLITSTDSTAIGATEGSSIKIDYRTNFGLDVYTDLWLTYIPTSDTSFNIVAQANNSDQPRYGTVTINAGSVSKIIKITQLGLTSNNLLEMRHNNIYPNPANKNLYINTTNPNTTVTISNNSGKILLKMQLKGIENHINISQLPVGLYIVTINDGKTIVNQKIIKAVY
jgi:hypothetical protein